MIEISHIFLKLVLCTNMTNIKSMSTFLSQGHNLYKLKYISLEEVKIVPFQQ